MEQKRFDKKNLVVIGVLILLIAAVSVAAALQKRELNPTLGELAADATAVPTVAAEADAAAPTASPEGSKAPAEAYLVVTVAGAMYEPIPLEKEGRYTISRGDMVNVIEVTPTSIRMHSSTCDNQDCVEQGLVSLENREKRVLRNMIICLPNDVALELYTPEELVQMMISLLEESGEAADE